MALSADGDLVAPVTDVTDMVFDLSAPGDPSWKAWAQEVKGSSEAGRARSCVDPDAWSPGPALTGSTVVWRSSAAQ